MEPHSSKTIHKMLLFFEIFITQGCATRAQIQFIPRPFDDPLLPRVAAAFWTFGTAYGAYGATVVEDCDVELLG
jgi:hypothetical protein